MEREEYQAMAQVEGGHWWYAGMRELAAALIDSVLDGRSNQRILDAGCGTGGNLLFLQRYGSVAGLDLSPLAVAVSAQRLPGLVQRGSVLTLPYADSSFDLVTSFDVLYHRAVPDETQALAEVRRVLRPGGWLLLRLPAYQWLLRKHDRAVHTRRRYRSLEVSRLLVESGFHVARISYVNTLLFPIPLAQWLVERAFPQFQRRQSDLEMPGPLLNRLLRVPLALEAAWLRRGGSLPFGLSILCLARKEEL